MSEFLMLPRITQASNIECKLSTLHFLSTTYKNIFLQSVLNLQFMKIQWGEFSYFKQSSSERVVWSRHLLKVDFSNKPVCKSRRAAKNFFTRIEKEWKSILLVISYNAYSLRLWNSKAEGSFLFILIWLQLSFALFALERKYHVKLVSAWKILIRENVLRLWAV